MNKAQYELLLKQKEKLKSQYYASIFITIIEIIALLYFGVIALFFIIIFTLFEAILKIIPFQLKKQIEDVEIQLAGYKEKKNGKST